MKMIKEEKEFKMVKEEKVTHINVFCDCCEKLIIRYKTGGGGLWNQKKVGWWNVTTGHNDWGNDSCESREDYNICKDCITEFVKSYTDKTRTESSNYLEMEHEWHYDYMEENKDD